MKRQFVRGLLFLLGICSAANSGWSQDLVKNGNFNAAGAVIEPKTPVPPNERIPSWNMLRANWHVDLSETAPVPEVSVLKAQGSGDKATQLSQDIVLEPGKIYTMSAWMRAENLINIPSKPVGLVVTNWGWVKGVPLAEGGEIGPEWQPFSKTFVAPEPVLENGVEQPYQIRIFLPSGETGTIWITAIKVVEGEQAADSPQGGS